MIKGPFYTFKLQEQEYSEELQECIEAALRHCVATTTGQSLEKAERPLMMLGKIQSGKTRAFTGLMALAFDNGYDVVVILTKNSKALIQQTYRRMCKEFRPFIVDHEIEVFDIMKAVEGLTRYELDKKLVVVAKKEKRNLDRILRFIENHITGTTKRCLVIDDEADTTGIGFVRTRDSDDEFDLRTVAAKLNQVRGSLDGYAFVQVTATPYALYLQPDFDEAIVKPIRPHHTVLVPQGHGYIGGEYYFVKAREDSHPGRFIYAKVPEDELEIISKKSGDRRRFKEEEILTRTNRLTVFKKALMSFIVGGCVLRRMHPKAHFAFVVHTSTQKASHLRLENITGEFLRQIRGRHNTTTPLIHALLQDSYADIARSVTAFGYSMPPFEAVEQDFYYAVDREYVSLTIVNSDRDLDTLLDQDTGELRLRSPFSIFVGGQVLDRGVTIPRMIGFYYGRNPITMQQDTVMQHSRMFGYRGPDLLSVTRFYTTRRIYESMTQINEIDMLLREDIENGRSGQGVYFMQRRPGFSEDIKKSETVRIAPCSPEKIALSNVVTLKPGSRILPIGFSVMNRAEASKAHAAVSQIIDRVMKPGEKGATSINQEVAEQLVSLAYGVLVPDEESTRFITHDRFLATLRHVSSLSQVVHLVVRQDRTASRFKDGGSVYQDSPDTPQDDLSYARKAAIAEPALILLHQKGEKDKGWNDIEFWWPVLVVPQQWPVTILAHPEMSGRLKSSVL